MVRTVGLKAYSDIHYTRPEVAKKIVDFYTPGGRILEPFRGGGAFYGHLPDGTLWTEIAEAGISLSLISKWTG